MYDYIPQSKDASLRLRQNIELEEIRKYLCENLVVEFYSYDGTLEVKLNMECELVNHIDEYLRVHFYFGKETKPHFRNDDVPLNSPEA